MKIEAWAGRVRGTGERARVKLTPSLARRSRLGVATREEPLQLR